MPIFDEFPPTLDFDTLNPVGSSWDPVILHFGKGESVVVAEYTSSEQFRIDSLSKQQIEHLLRQAAHRLDEDCPIVTADMPIWIMFC